MGEFVASESIDERLAAAELIGWQVDEPEAGCLMNLAIEDPAREVRHAAQAAIARRRRHEWAVHLLKKASESSGIRVWSYMEHAIALGDPWLLQTRSDAIWLGRYFPKGIPGLELHVREALKRRAEKVASEAEEADRRQRD